MATIEKIVETQDIATLPTIAIKILSFLENENVDIRSISHIIETDAPLTMKVLKVANSPIYGLRSPVTSIPQAIITIGLNRLANIVIGISIFSQFIIKSHPKSKELLEKFWWHSSSTAVVSKNLSGKLGKNYKELEFIGGLLHDIGKLILIQYDINSYSKVIDLITYEHLLDIEAEAQIFQTNHLLVGEYLARKWNLPEALIDVIGFHSRMPLNRLNLELVSIVRFSDLLCEIWDAGFYEGFQKIEFDKQESWINLCTFFPELKELDLEKFTFELEDDFKKSSDFLKIISST
ncbi:MAG: HDOD domain-containing protein [Candidatus Kapaibacteriales bacterium]